jgi:hypothetical protein
MVNLVMTVANWFTGVWAAVTGAFTGAWGFVADVFTGIWENLKGVVLGFVEWLSPVMDVIHAPFSAIGNAIGRIAGKVSGAAGAGNEAAAAKQAELALAAAPGLQAASATVTTAAGQSPAATGLPAPEVPQTTVSAPALQPVTAQPVPAAAGPVTAVPAFSGAVSMGPVPIEPVTAVPSFTGAAGIGAAPALDSAAAGAVPVSPAVPAATESVTAFAAPPRASAPELTHTASSAFTDALGLSAMSTLAPGIDMSDLERQVDMRLQAVPIPQAPVIEPPRQKNGAEPLGRTGPVSITVNNLTVQAKDIQEAVDFYHILINGVHQPEEAAV